MPVQNRTFERFPFATPVDATAGTVAVSLIDVSRTGFKVHHLEQLPAKGEAFPLRFLWNGSVVRMQCVAIWTTIHRIGRSVSERPTLSSGLRIESADATAQTVIDSIIASLTQPTEYLFCEFVSGAWKRTRTTLRDQPGDGFTVSLTEDAFQVERLCSAYASGDFDTRKLIRTLAALSIKSQSDAP